MLVLKIEQLIYQTTYDKLSAIDVPTHLLTSVASVDAASDGINRFYSDIVQCLWDSSLLVVPRKKRNSYKFW